MPSDVIKKILRWFEGFVQIDLFYFLKGGFWLSLSQVVMTVSSLVLGYLFANFLSKQTYGTYSYILTLVYFLSIPTLSGIDTAVSQAIASGHDAQIMKAFKTQVRWGLLGSLGALIIGAYYLVSGNITLAVLLLIVAVFVPLMEPSGIYAAALTGKKLFNLSAIYAIVTQLLVTILTVGVVLMTKNLYLMVVVYFLPNIVLDLFFLNRTVVLTKGDDVDPNVISYGKHLTLMNVTATIASYLDRFLVFHFLGPIELAIYSIAVTPPEQIKGILANAHYLSLPKLAEQKTQMIKAAMTANYLKLFILGAVTIGVYIILSPSIYKVLFPKYPESVFYTQLFSISMLNFALFPALTYLQAKRKIKEQYQISLISSVFQIVSMVILIIKWGLLGLIIARIASRYFGSLLGAYYFEKVTARTSE